jgi:hypothetical protein
MQRPLELGEPALVAAKRPGALAPAPGKEQNPMGTAMSRAAQRHPFNRQAILRGRRLSAMKEHFGVAAMARVSGPAADPLH